MTEYLVKKEPQVEASRVKMIGGVVNKDRWIFSHLDGSLPAVKIPPWWCWGLPNLPTLATTLNTCAPFYPGAVETHLTYICSVVYWAGIKKLTKSLSNSPWSPVHSRSLCLRLQSKFNQAIFHLCTLLQTARLLNETLLFCNETKKRFYNLIRLLLINLTSFGLLEQY